MGLAQELFKAFLSGRIAPRLRAEGFRRKEATFWLSEGDNWGVLSFQKSTASTANEVRFTANVGIASARLRERKYGWREGARPGAWDSHLLFRLGELLPDKPPGDYWWLIDAETDLDQLSSDFDRYLDTAVPFLRSLLHDEDLRDYWWAKLEAGVLGDEELMFLTTLLEKVGPSERLDQLEAKLARADAPHARAERRRRADETIAVGQEAARAFPDRLIRTPRRVQG